MTKTFGNAWYLARKRYDIPELRAWCEKNLTPDSWCINENMAWGTFEVCVGIDTEVVAFRSRWFHDEKIKK